MYDPTRIDSRLPKRKEFPGELAAAVLQVTAAQYPNLQIETRAIRAGLGLPKEHEPNQGRVEEAIEYVMALRQHPQIAGLEVEFGYRGEPRIGVRVKDPHNPGSAVDHVEKILAEHGYSDVIAYAAKSRATPKQAARAVELLNMMFFGSVNAKAAALAKSMNLSRFEVSGGNGVFGTHYGASGQGLKQLISSTLKNAGLGEVLFETRNTVGYE